LSTNTSDGGNWLTATPTSGAATSTVTVGIVNTNLPGGGLTEGRFTGELVFRGPNSIISVPVSVGVGANFQFNQLGTLTFTKTFGGSNPAAQTPTITSLGANFTFDVKPSTGNGGNWLATADLGCCFTTPRLEAVSIIASPSLAVGTYTG